MKKILSIGIGLLISASSVFAEEIDLEKGEQLYKKCISCHGIKAEKKALGKSVSISGWDKETLVQSMIGYQDGTYGGPMKSLMKGQIVNFSQEEIEIVSEYIVHINK